ncbi:MAG: hypothetical protein EOO04_02580 [Chitinophagaceae bacterium]|nr:MAG: hypothetical protein EOO04_02580 [Chitinophagaceae bacterium]
MKEALIVRSVHQHHRSAFIQTGTNDSYAFDYLLNEAQSLLSRLHQVKPFSMTMPMVQGAAVSFRAMEQISELLENGKAAIFRSINEFIATIEHSKKAHSDAAALQTRFSLLKLRYNSILDQLDIFADVLAQRSEHGVGIWLSGLDVLAEDGLKACSPLAPSPALMVYIDRGHGAAIRRANTKLPGGDTNPVAVIQVPRERMVGSGVASSLIHEIGHQAVESIDLSNQLRRALHLMRERQPEKPWHLYAQWISEILADCWSMGHLGVTATMGLMGVVSLPSYFQFRLDMKGPHPPPYIRVKLSCAFGKALFPGKHWDRLWQTWMQFYPKDELPAPKLDTLADLDSIENEFVQLVLGHKSPQLKGNAFGKILPTADRQPAQLKKLYKQWQNDSATLDKSPPTLVFAVFGQAKYDLTIDANEENALLSQILRNWAYRRK